MKTCDFNHLILYAKSHYKRGDELEDVRHILAVRCGLEDKHMRNGDVWMLCVNALFKYAPSRDRIQQSIQSLFKPVLGENGNQLPPMHDDNCPIRRAIHYVLVELMQIRVVDDDGDDTLGLGKPDPAVLPLRQK